jgi:hypothetical protein
VLSPLQLSGAGVTQCIVRVPGRSGVLSFVERGKRRQDQPCRSESRRAVRRVSYGVSLHASHYCPKAQGSFRNTRVGTSRLELPRVPLRVLGEGCRTIKRTEVVRLLV